MTFSLTATEIDLAQSVRSECEVDHGCPMDKEYERELEAGTYNYVLMTANPASYTVDITFSAP